MIDRHSKPAKCDCASLPIDRNFTPQHGAMPAKTLHLAFLAGNRGFQKGSAGTPPPLPP